VRPFTYNALPGRIVFGVGCRSEIASEVDALGLRRIMVIADENAKADADELVDLLDDRVVTRWHEIAQHVPTELADAARHAATDHEIDGIVTVGGGSTTGLGKAIALVRDAPIVAVPTTYAGSEMTPIYGLTGEHKETGRDLRVLPRAVVYDPELTVDLPVAVTTTSAFNAIAHSVEALYGPDSNPITSLMAQDAIRVLTAALPRLNADPHDVDLRSDLLYGAYLAGAVLAAVGMALHHKVCHVLGGSFGLVHGDVNAVVLPHVVAYNAKGAPEAIDKVGSAMDVADPAAALFDLAAAVGAPVSLESLGMPHEGLDEAARRTVSETSFNPTAVDEPSIRRLLEAAWRGQRPQRRGAAAAAVGLGSAPGPLSGAGPEPSAPGLATTPEQGD
jgi:alcohol dehydrogenase class IV